MGGETWRTFAEQFGHYRDQGDIRAGEGAMRVLGLSSATKVISLGLVDGEKVLIETTLADIRAERIMSYVREAGIEPAQVEAVAVAVGPGSYSGLRGGLATAKSLAQTLNVPLVGVPTLEAIAYNLIDINGTMAVVLDARLDEHNCALFGASRGKLRRLTDDLVLKLVALKERLSRISGELWLVGNVKELKDIKGDNFHFTDDRQAHPYGMNVARLGLEKLKAGQADDWLELNPTYSHKPHFREFGP
jgi:tRNA threonylcarbamoyladenosine biosynthesis protein TsaB